MTLGTALGTGGELFRRRSVLLAIVLLCAVVGCSPPIGRREIGPGAQFTTQSGLTVTVPRGAVATIVTPAADEVASDVPSTQFVHIRFDTGVIVSVMSFAKQAPPSVDATVVGQGVGFVVRDRGGDPSRAVIDTDIDGAAPGRIVVFADRDGRFAERGMAAARRAAQLIDLQGVSIR